MAVATDAAGNVYLGGFFAGTGTLGSFVLEGPEFGGVLFVAKLDPQGRPLWVRQTGGNPRAQVQGLAVSPSGEVYLVGGFNGEITLGAFTLKSAGEPIPSGPFTIAVDDILVAALSPDGEVRWAKRFGGVLQDFGQAAALSPDGDIVIGGGCAGGFLFGDKPVGSSGGSDDACLARLSPSGEVRWATTGGGYGTDEVRSLAVDRQGQVFAVGQVHGPASFAGHALPGVDDYNGFLVKLSPQGGVQWAKPIGADPTHEGATAVALEPEGRGVIVAGSFETTLKLAGKQLKAHGGGDLFLARFSTADGAAEWARAVGGAGDEFAGALTVDARGTIYLAASFEQMLVLDAFTLAAAGGEDVLLAAFSPQGTARWVISGGGTSSDSGSALALASDRSLVVGGQTRGRPMFGDTVLTTPGLDFYVWKLAPP